MAAGDEKRPIIIKKKKAGHGGAHGGAWKLAYADFVTAMMAFFLVMWIVGLDVKTRQGLAAYFSNPGAFPVNYHSSPYIMSLDGKPPLNQALVEESQREDHNVDVSTAERLIGQLKVELEDKRFVTFKSWVDIKLTDEGVRVEFREAPGGKFFVPNKTRLFPEGQYLIQTLGMTIVASRRQMVQEGHCAKPRVVESSGAFRLPGDHGAAALQLAGDRAQALFRELLAIGMNAEQTSAVLTKGWTVPARVDDVYAVENDRVAIVVRY